MRGRSLWEATLEFVTERGTVLQADVPHRFRHDDEATVRGVLTDLVDSGMVFRSGRGTRTAYRAARPDELELGNADDGADRAAHLVWVAVSRFGPAGPDAIAEAVPLDRAALDLALERLVREGRVARVERGAVIEYRTDLCVIPYGTPVGWEAAVFDHYQAVVTAICTKLRSGATTAAHDDRVGGSTYGLTVWPGHPHHEEALNLLGRLRAEANGLREKVTSWNATHAPPENASRIIAYVGQTVLGPEPDEGEPS